MDLGGIWLAAESDDDLRRLFGDLGTGLNVEQEATGVNLFAVISARANG